MTRAWFGAMATSLSLVACMEQSFHPSPLDEEEAAEDTGVEEHDEPFVPFEYDTADTGGGGEHQQDGDPEPEDDISIHEPQVCSEDTMVWMSGTPAHCPADHAAFMMDDGHGPNFVCCPLPSDDILLHEPSVDRGTSCGADEVITGFTGEYSYSCAKVNTERYQVSGAQEPCYFGSGSSGGSGVSGCDDHPHTWDVLQQSLFGSDGCSGYPYGSLFVSQTGKDCEDQRTVQIAYNGLVEGDPTAGTPVEMFVD